MDQEFKSPVLSQLAAALMGEAKVVEIPSTPITTHYCFEGPNDSDE